MQMLFEALETFGQLASYAVVGSLIWVVGVTWYGSFIWAFQQGKMLRGLLCFLVPVTGLVLMGYQFLSNRYGQPQAPTGIRIEPARSAVESLFRSASWKL